MQTFRREENEEEKREKDRFIERIHILSLNCFPRDIPFYFQVIDVNIWQKRTGSGLVLEVWSIPHRRSSHSANAYSGSFSRAAERACFGAKVLHSATIRPAVEGGLPVYVLDSFKELREKVDRVLILVKPDQTPEVAEDAIKAGIRRIWIQQGAESKDALRICQEHGISPVHGHCILMFAEPTTSFHWVHRKIWKLIGKIPK